MIDKLLMSVILIGSFFLPTLCFAEAHVLEGDEAKSMYEQKKMSLQTLKQIGTMFTLVAPNGTETTKPDEMTVKVGEYIFITNQEEKIVHNVYDESDHSWVLKKQQPGGVAAIAFDAAGVHKLRCAIHPKMRITVNVVE